MNKKLLDIIVCPVCKGKLTHEPEGAAPERLVCRWDKLAYPVHDGIPVLIENQAQPWPSAGDETKK